MAEAAPVYRKQEFCGDVRELFASFAGQQIEGASCIEMAFYGEEASPKFEHPGLPFVQATALELVLSRAGRVHVKTWTDQDTKCGLLAETAPAKEALGRSFPGGAGSIYRHRTLTEFQGVKVERVDLSADDAGVISEVRFQVPGAGIHLVAGEVYEAMDGRLTVKADDESVLIFLGDDARDRISFDTPV